jgi:MFS family permease
MAAESAPRDRMPQSIGLVQTAQRLGPAIGPVIGGVMAAVVGLRGAFLVTAGFYAVALIVVFVMYNEQAANTAPAGAAERGPVAFRDVLAFRNFLLLMGVIFAFQFVDRSYGPVLPLYIEGLGVSRVPLVAGVLFSIMACTGALGHHFCARLLTRYRLRTVIAGGSATAAVGSLALGATGNLWIMAGAAVVLGVGIGAAMTAAYTAAGAVIPAGAHGAGFGVITSASLTGMAVSPIVAGFVSGASIRIVFVADALLMAAFTVAVARTMRDAGDPQMPPIEAGIGR